MKDKISFQIFFLIRKLFTYLFINFVTEFYSFLLQINVVPTFFVNERFLKGKLKIFKLTYNIKRRPTYIG